jgi:hypothetical protein
MIQTTRAKTVCNWIAGSYDATKTPNVWTLMQKIWPKYRRFLNSLLLSSAVRNCAQ